MRKNPYLEVVYDPSQKPLTDYPPVFAAYLQKRLQIEEGMTLLDAGCGRGEMLNAFLALGVKCKGCDLEAPPEGTTAAEVKPVDFATEAFPYADGSFDVVLSKSVIEHLQDPDNYVKEMYRVLKPGGILIILTPDWVSQMRVFYEDHTHVHPYLPLGMERMLKLHGFQCVETERFSHHPFVWRSGIWRMVATVLRKILSTENARKLSKITGVRYFRWAVELQILGIGTK